MIKTFPPATDVKPCNSLHKGTEIHFLLSNAFTSQECKGIFFFNIQLYKVHMKCYMNYLSQVGELAILSLVITPTVQNKSFHSKYADFSILQFTTVFLLIWLMQCILKQCLSVILRTLDQIP